ncbi:MAG: transcription-repair coupling factor [Gemmatimonadota bacterium]|nr:MAG: transcription-repair coupling factor [Gemmatimonadota bacterium]
MNTFNTRIPSSLMQEKNTHMNVRPPLREIGELAKESASFVELTQKLQEGPKKIALTGLHGSSKSLLLTHLFQALSRPLMILTSTTQEAEEIRDDLESFIGRGSVRYYPSRDVHPFEGKAPTAETLGSRLETLADVTAQRTLIVVAPIKAVLEKVFSPATFSSLLLELHVGQTVAFDRFVSKLVELGFERQPLVETVGQFSVRGGIIDLFSFASKAPLRLDFFGESIESIRFFDIQTQRSTSQQQSATILPCYETHDVGEVSSADESCTLFQYLPGDTILFLEEPSLIHDQAQHISEQIQIQLHQYDSAHDRLKSSGFLSRIEDLENQYRSYSVLSHSSLSAKGKEVIDIGAKSQESFHRNLKLLREGLLRLLKNNYRSFLICDSRIQAERLEELVEDLKGNIHFIVGHIHHGFLLPDAQLAVYTDHEVFLRQRLPHHLPKYESGTPLRDYATLRNGDFVVHIDYGIGRFEGLERITARGKERECLAITYHSNDRLFVPIDQLQRVQKYVGTEGTVPTLSKLGGMQWDRTKEKTKKAIADMAADLIRIGATRKTQTGHAFQVDTEWQMELEAAFPYEETPDQLKATNEVKQDMEHPAPMDRLICGDVGYGKTEVAIRAAFKAVMDAKQVCVLVPTTILAQQHLKTFLDRFGDYPLRIEMLSRFKTRSEQKEILRNLKNGTVDIVIGTHRLLQKDIGFKDLGLVIVDEEHRFGVTHKERLKKLRTLVDVMTLTATPIPRTLHMSLMGARDMSIIHTAPKERLPIHTEISQFDEALIRGAILREVDRGGQIYFVHNRVQSIRAMASLLERVVPEVSVRIAHGQMDEKHLERVMIDFLEGRFNCLVSTMIIEAGLDIPNVNTIIINRADRFGLAQLYQLRGRVGRSDKMAYAYLLIPPFRSLTRTARQRLRALEEFTELGSGFQLAMRDLEIRGAGNILGPQQHGFLAAVGFDLYCKLLADAVMEAQGKSPEETPDPKIEISVSAFIPDKYVPDGDQKMMLYQRLAKISDTEEIRDLEEELTDRFGTPPKPVQSLLSVIAVKLLARQVGAGRIVLSDHLLRLEFYPGYDSHQNVIKKLISKSSVPFEFQAEKLLIAKASVAAHNDEEVLSLIKNILLHLL